MKKLNMEYQGFIQTLLWSSFFHERLSFMEVDHNPMCIRKLALCSWGFIWGIAPGSFVYFTDPRILNSRPFLELFLPS